MSGIEELRVEEFLDQLGIPIEAIIDNLDFLKGQKEKIHKYIPGETILLEQAIRDYINDISTGMSKTTIETKETELNGFLTCFCRRCINEGIKPALINVLETDINEYLCKPNTHNKDFSIKNSTFNKKLSILKVFFKIMVKKKFLEESPAVDIRMMPLSELPIQFLTREEQSKIFKIALKKRETAKRDFMILFLAMNAGLRLNEIWKLNITDFDYKRSTIKVRESKFKKDRDIPLTKKTAEVLRNYIEKVRGVDISNFVEPNMPIFLQSKGANKHDRISREACRKVIKRVFQNAGITEGASHRLRHTYAVNALQAGLSIVEIASILGHSHVSTTYIYLRLDNKDVREKMEKQFPLAFLSLENIEEHIKAEEQNSKVKNAIKKLGDLS